MDISFRVGNERFHYRVCGIILSEGNILAMRDTRSPFYFLPGGRVRMGESAEAAVIREMQEELGAALKVQRPLWINESFFTDDIDHLHYHKLCFYFLMDAAGTDLLLRGQKFHGIESEKGHVFEWLPFERLKNEYFYPLFLKEKIFEIPDSLTLITTVE